MGICEGQGYLYGMNWEGWGCRWGGVIEDGGDSGYPFLI